MAKLYKGNLTLNWYNKQKAILLQDEQNVRTNDVPAPNINWINKDEALFYEINEQEGKGVTPYWVDRTDIRIKESRSLKFRKAFKANYVDKSGGVPGLSQELETEELEEDDSTIENMLIKGDNLLVLNTLKKMYYNKPDEDKIKCIYIDPPYNSGNAFIDYDDNMQHSQWLTMMRDRIELLYQLLKNDGFLFIQIDDKECAYLTILIHEIFGRENCKVVAVKMAEPTGLKMASVIKKGSIPKLKEYIIIAGKNGISGLDIERIPKEKWDNEYKTYLSNISKEEVNILKEIRENEERTEEDIELADEILSKIQTCRLSEQYLLNRIENEEDKNIFNYENAWRIIRITSISGNAKFLADKKRNDNNNKFF